MLSRQVLDMPPPLAGTADKGMADLGEQTEPGPNATICGGPEAKLPITNYNGSQFPRVWKGATIEGLLEQ